MATIAFPRPVRGALASFSAPGGVPYSQAMRAFVRCCSYTVGIRQITHRRNSPMNEIFPLSRVDLAAIVRAHLTIYTRDKTGREAPDRSRLLALDALADLENEVA